MLFLKQFLLALFSFALLDFTWLGYVVKEFNLKSLSEIGRIENGNFDMLFGPAILVYILMSLGIVVFVMPHTKNASFKMSFAWGAALGFLVYGVYDFTNLAILKEYPLQFALVDMAWGTFAFGAVTMLTKIGTSFCNR